MISIEPVMPEFVAVIGGVDLSRLTDDVFLKIEAAFERYAVLVFHDQPISEEQQLAFATRFGPLEVSVQPFVATPGGKRRIQVGFSDISNLDEHGRLLEENDNRRFINLANQLWHTDSSFKRTPGKMSMLSAQEVVTEGGETEFADMRAAWDALPDARKSELEPLVAEHDYFHSRKKVGLDPHSITPERRALRPAVPQVLVRTHPVNGRKSLYLASHITRIFGMDETRARPLVEELMAHATQPRFIYTHHWAVNDVVMWDNRCTMHRGRPHDERLRRAMRRATVSDVGPTVPEDWNGTPIAGLVAS
jgi:alpha-ketoglutarate-dependent 2,4-dichlorophenoxyacetate dioxygenase